MKDRPILMCGEMVRATLADVKTNTRRVINPQPQLTPSGLWNLKGRIFGTLQHENGGHTELAKPLSLCPYGHPGDRLWVRETWGFDEAYCAGPQYRASWPQSDIDHAANVSTWRWKPSIHMPRRYSRITLEIVEIRVERVQEITENDAKAEGVAPAWLDVNGETVNAYARPTFRQGFAKLWNAINVERGFGWDVNPWVWVVKFGRVVA